MYAREFNESFEFSFVSPSGLTAPERQVFSKTEQLLGLVEVDTSREFDVRISETMRLTASDTEGVWDKDLGAIVIKRTSLSSLQRYAGTLLHEAAHAMSGYPDSSRLFEGVLTDFIGLLAARALSS